MRPLLEVIGISKQFGGLAALKKVSFQVAERSIFGLIGPNGAGKTTLFNVVAGAMRPTGGEVRLNGKNLTGKRSFRMVQEGVSRTHQIVAPFRSMTVLENVLVGVHFGRAPVRRMADAIRRALEILGWVGMEHLAKTSAEVLSLGHQKRLEVARALANEPALLLCDEICGGLTHTETASILGLLREIRKKGTTVIYVEHDVKAITSVCDRILVLNSGEKLTEGTPEEIQKNPAVIEAYLGHPRTAAGSAR